MYNARLRGWQRIPLNSITTTVTTATHWDWKRHALTVPLEAFVRFVLRSSCSNNHPIHHPLATQFQNLATNKS
ncbi:hypothetical protein BVZ13_18690 [Vibrio cholerae]|nr:hypothetical protein [Vibrio cholerae]EGR5566916.1 hypothetical protein [Vibrio cholerae]EGR5575288.1 hypothetical protein [Vibrio cholerae]EGR5734197.1 hypothetical protein [Vibrio cholerae]